MALSDSVKSTDQAEMQWSQRGELVPPPRDYSPLAQAVIDTAKKLAAERPHVPKPRVAPPVLPKREGIGRQLTGTVCKLCGKPQYKTPSGPTCGDHGGAPGVAASLFNRGKRAETQADEPAEDVPHGMSNAEALASTERADPLKQKHEWALKAGQFTKVTPQDNAYFADPNNDGKCLFAIGPVEQEFDPGFSPVFEMLPEAVEHKAEIGDGLWRLPRDKREEPELIDVWIDARKVGSTRYVPGWAVNQAREECLEMAKATTAPKKNFGATGAPSAPAKPALPVRQRPAGPSVKEPALQSDDVPGQMTLTGPYAESENAAGENGQPAEEQPKVGKNSKRNVADPLAIQQGETIDDLKARMQKGGDNSEQVFVAIGKTINIGNYESVRIDVGVVRSLTEGQSFEDLKGDVASEAFELLNTLKAEVVAAVEGGQL